MSFAAIGIGAGASLGGSAIQASAGKKGAEAQSNAELAGLGQANRTIRDAISQYSPYRAGGDQAYRQMQRLYGFQPAGGDPNAPRRLTSQEKRRADRLNALVAGGGTLTPRQQRDLGEIRGLRQRRRDYRNNFASTVGQDEERALLGLEEAFGREEQGIFDRQQLGLDEYRQRNQILDNQFTDRAGAMDRDFAQNVGYMDQKYKNDVAAQDAQAIWDLYHLDQGFSKGSKELDAGFTQGAKDLDEPYFEEERALRDKIAKGDVTLDPGYKFRLEQGQLARERGAAARGGLLSGGHLKDLEEYSQGLASQEFGAATGRLYDLYGLGEKAHTQRRGNLEGDYERGRRYLEGDYERGRRYRTGDYERSRGYISDDYTTARGYRTNDYTRGRGYLTDDYTRARDYGRTDYSDLQSFYANDLTQRGNRFTGGTGRAWKGANSR